MKQLIIIISFLLLSLMGFSQATSVADLRITDAITEFGVNISIGTEVYNIDTEESFKAIAAVGSTETLTTASASFKNSSAVSFGIDNEIPIINAAGDDFEYTQFFKYNSAGGFISATASGFQSSTTSASGIIAAGSFFGTSSANGLGVVAHGSEIDFAAGTSGLFRTIEKASSPSTPLNGYGYFYFKIDGKMYAKNDAGVEYDLTIASSMVQNVDNGAKTASFTHDAASSSIGGYTLSTSGAVTISIHNLVSGHQGTIFLEIATIPSVITVSPYSDAGSTLLDKVPIGAAITNEVISITYTCIDNGTNTLVYLVYGHEL